MAGQTNFVALGGTGYKVVGSVKLPSSEPESQIDWQSDVQTLTTKPPGFPERQAFSSQAAWMKGLEDVKNYWQSEVGQEAERNQRSYVLIFEKNGSFKINDVVPGTYKLRIAFSGAGTLTKEITIPESAGQEEATIDLGTLELQSPRSRAGQEPEEGTK